MYNKKKPALILNVGSFFYLGKYIPVDTKKRKKS